MRGIIFLALLVSAAMSWSLSVMDVPRDKLSEELEGAKDAQLAEAAFDSWDGDVEEQMNAAIASAVDMARTIRQDRVTVQVSGHQSRVGPDAETFAMSMRGVVPPAG